MYYKSLSPILILNLMSRSVIKASKGGIFRKSFNTVWLNLKIGYSCTKDLDNKKSCNKLYLKNHTLWYKAQVAGSRHNTALIPNKFTRCAYNIQKDSLGINSLTLTGVMIPVSVSMLICGMHKQQRRQQTKQRQFKTIWVVVVYKKQHALANWDHHSS